MGKRTLIICPHLDDESLSCGVLIQKRLFESKTSCVRILVLSGRRYQYQTEEQSFQQEYADFKDALSILSRSTRLTSNCLNFAEGEPYSLGYYRVLLEVEDELSSFNPDEVILPSKYDLNQDHRHYAEIGGIALRAANLGGGRRLLSMVALDSARREPTYFVPFSKEELDVKLRAVAAYSREARVSPHPRSPENITAFHRVMGAKVGEVFAEPYFNLMSKE